MPALVARALRSREVGGVALLVMLLTLFGALRWWMMSGAEAPPGSDGGNWLAFSRELFGDRVKAADAAYPPGFPLLLSGALHFMSPLTALKVLGLATAASLSIPAYLLLRTALVPWLAAVLAATVAVMDYHSEVLAWGGYPQLLGTTFLLLSLYLFALGLRDGRSWLFVASGLCTALTVATHTLAALQLLLALVAIVVIRAYVRRGSPAPYPKRRLMAFLLIWVMSAGAVVAAAVPFYVRTIDLMAGNPANPHQFDFAEFLLNFGEWRDENYMWLVIGVAGVVITAWVVLSRRLFLAEVVVALLLSSLLGFAFLHEIRSAHLLQVALLLAIGVAVASVRAGFPKLPAVSGRRAARLLAVGLVVVILAGLLSFGQRRATIAFDWFRVVDSEVLASLDWLRERSEPGGVVVAGEAPNGGVMGWWVEGYSGLPTYHAVDPRWLSFREEKEQAEVASGMLSPDSGPEQLRALADAHDIRFVLLHKEISGGQVPNLLEAGFVPRFENDDTIILEYSGRGAT